MAELLDHYTWYIKSPFHRGKDFSVGVWSMSRVTQKSALTEQSSLE